MGDDRADGLSAVGDGGQAAISLMPDVVGTDSGPEIKILHHYTISIQYDTVKYTKTLPEIACDNAHQTHELTYMIGCVHAV